MTKICHITTAHNVWDTRIFRRECVSLAKAGYHVTLVAVHDKEEIVDGVHVVPLPRPRSKIQRRLGLTKHAVDVARTLNSDLYHFHDPELIPSMRQLSRKSSRPIVWDAHEVYTESIYNFNQFKLRPISYLASKYFDWLELAASVKDFAGVVTVTDRMAERYTSRGIDTCVLGNFPDISAIPYPPKVKRAARFRVISTGVHYIERGVFELVDAFIAAHREVPCEIAFWGTFDPPGLAHELQERLRAGGVPTQDIIVNGPFPWSTLMGELIPTGWVGAVLFRSTDPNLTSSHPNRFFECWANHVPVIVSAHSVVGKIAIEEGGGMAVEQTTPQAIGNAIIELARNPALVDSMGEAGRKAVEKKYNWNNAFQGLLSFYERINVPSPH